MMSITAGRSEGCAIRTVMVEFELGLVLEEEDGEVRTTWVGTRMAWRSGRKQSNSRDVFMLLDPGGTVER
jgi:fructose/tagatose bisphosphate aldolase